MTRTAPPPSLLEVIEAARLSALHSYGILDSGPAPEFNQLAEFMAQSVRAPVALISFIDRDRQWVKAGVGLPVAEVPRYLSFCHHTIAAQAGMLVVSDLSADVRFDYHPLVQGTPFLRFYAGLALTDRDGYRLGTVSVMDRRSAEFSAADWEVLQQVAARVVELLVAQRDAGPASGAALPPAAQSVAAPVARTMSPHPGVRATPPVLTGPAARQAQPHSFTAPYLAAPGDAEAVQPGRAWLGVKTDLAPPLPGSGEMGRLVRRVARNSPAERAGLQAGDVLLSVNQQPTRRSDDIVTALASQPIGGRAELRLWRSGQRVQVSILVEAAPSSHNQPGVPQRTEKLSRAFLGR